MKIFNFLALLNRKKGAKRAIKGVPEVLACECRYVRACECRHMRTCECRDVRVYLHVRACRMCGWASCGRASAGVPDVRAYECRRVRACECRDVRPCECRYVRASECRHVRACECCMFGRASAGICKGRAGYLSGLGKEVLQTPHDRSMTCAVARWRLTISDSDGAVQVCLGME